MAAAAWRSEVFFSARLARASELQEAPLEDLEAAWGQQAAVVLPFAVLLSGRVLDPQLLCPHRSPNYQQPQQAELQKEVVLAEADAMEAESPYLQLPLLLMELSGVPLWLASNGLASGTMQKHWQMPRLDHCRIQAQVDPVPLVL